MASYRLLIKPSAVGELERVPLKDPRRIVARIERLASDPRPAAADKLSGQEKYRLRQGDYRILFSVDDAEMTIVIVKVGHRREVYR